MGAASRKKAEFHPSVGPTAHLVLEPREPEETLSSEDQLQFELAAFDRKVLAAQTAMQQHMTGKLKRMGVPFFGTQPDLVVPEASATSANRPKWSPLITGAQLRELQMRMIQHLEDMYKD
ncbi:hypothetical protein H2203_000915 [Taxawa tesnikishii (nom. ined.)]|nr:hypothetical protein H2203_000915 [Dothideales sp. JES 119]